LYVGRDEERSLLKNVGYMRTFVPRILDAVALLENPEEQLGVTTRDLRTQLQIALRLTVGFANI